MDNRKLKRRRRPRTRRRRMTKTWTTRMVVTEAPPGFTMDAETDNAVLYATALHVGRFGVSLHGISIRDLGIRLLFTCAGNPREFLNSIATDVAGYCDARFDGRGTRVDIAELRITDSLEDRMEALVQIGIDGEPW